MKLDLCGHTLTLLPGKGALLEDRTLVVADLHLGKASAFQARGLAVPEGDSEADLERLALIAAACSATRIVVAGDLFHSPAGLTPAIEKALLGWLEQMPIPVQLVIGNHDAKLRRLPRELSPVTVLDCGGIHIVHDPEDACDEIPSISGHWHPVARIGDGRNTALRLPCFLLRRSKLVVPSFGRFTGGRIMDAEVDDRYFVSPANRVIEVPGALIR